MSQQVPFGPPGNGYQGGDPKAQAKAERAYRKASRPFYKKKRFIIPAGLVALLIIAGIAGGGSSTKDSTTTTAAGSASSAPSTPAAPTASSAPAAPNTQSEATKPKPADFKLGIKILKQTCFGSAGCNVTYRIMPAFTGATPLKGSYEVTYTVTGDESGPQINTFKIEDGTSSTDSESTASTKSAQVVLTATVTDVSRR